MIEEGIGGTGRALADRYRTQLREEPLEILSEDDFIAERDASVARQKWKLKTASRLRRCWRGTRSAGKKRPHHCGQTFISDSGMMMIINARLSYTETRG